MAQVAQTRAQTQVSPVVIGDAAQLRSKKLREMRALLVSNPLDMTAVRTGIRSYTCWMVRITSATRLQASILLAANDRIPSMLVIGIASGDSGKRTHDLTPPSSADNDNHLSPGNGGDAFLSFLAGELIPYVDQTYRTLALKL
jgi:hypothetical protein